MTHEQHIIIDRTRTFRFGCSQQRTRDALSDRGMDTSAAYLNVNAGIKVRPIMGA